MILNEVFIEFIELLNKHKVKYVLVGGWAVIFEGYQRTTADIDFFIKSEKENAQLVLDTVEDFMGSTIGFTIEDLTKENNVLMIGREPLRIDLLTSISGVTFDEVYDNSKIYKDGDVEIRCIHINELMRNKEASGRLKDLADLEKLKKINAKRVKK
ncbi:MAG: nucleotidyltransferase [Chitinophagaceae bacterium]|jgi:hypothetical protein